MSDNYDPSGRIRLGDVVDYTVPTGTVLAANGYLVVAPVPADIAAVPGEQQCSTKPSPPSA